MFPKSKRIVDDACLAIFRAKPCVACRKHPPSDPAHLTTVKAGGNDSMKNVMSLCRQHHTEQHTIGWVKMSKKYYRVRYALRRMGRAEIGVDGVKNA